MLVNSVYDTPEQIPEFARNEFERRASDGKMVLKQDAIPGAAELFNTGLAANRDRALQQKQAADTARDAAEARARTLDEELTRLRQPGAVILVGDDAKTWQTLSTLETPVKELPKIIREELPTLRQRVAKSELDTTLRDINEKSHVKLNVDVLTDWLSGERGKGLKAVLKPVEILDDKQQKVTVQMPFIVKQEPTGTNTFKETETLLTDFATANLPAYLASALTQVGDAGATGGGNSNASGSTTGGNVPQIITGAFRLPDLGGASPAGTKGATKGATGAAAIVESFNAERDTRKNPLTPNAPASTGAGNAGQG